MGPQAQIVACRSFRQMMNWPQKKKLPVCQLKMSLA